MRICHLYIFGEASVQIFCLPFNWVVFLLSFNSCLYIFDASPIPIQVCFADLFFHFGLSFLLTVTYIAEVPYFN